MNRYMKKMAESREQECNTLGNWKGIGAEQLPKVGYAQNTEFRGFGVVFFTDCED